MRGGGRLSTVVRVNDHKKIDIVEGRGAIVTLASGILFQKRFLSATSGFLFGFLGLP